VLELRPIGQSRVRVRLQVLLRRVPEPGGGLDDRHAAQMPERGATMPQVVRRERRDTCGLARPRKSRTEPVSAEAGRRGIQARIAWPKSAHGSGLGAKRWVVERTIAWLHQYRRLRVRYERRDDIHEAFLAIGCSLICLKLLALDAPPALLGSPR